MADALAFAKGCCALRPWLDKGMPTAGADGQPTAAEIAADLALPVPVCPFKLAGGLPTTFGGLPTEME